MVNKKDGKKIFGKNRTSIIVVALLFSECLLIALGLMFLPGNVLAGVGQNVTVITQLTVGNVYPEIISITVSANGSSVDLVANGTKTVIMSAIVRDYNADSDINKTMAYFFDKNVSTQTSADDNNSHYTNSSCIRDDAYGTAYETNITCTFEVWYYANNQSWNMTLIANDTYQYSAMNSTSIQVNTLLSIGLPTSIDYGTVNATQVSNEIIANVTNFGNVGTNLTLEGYALNRFDNLSMNCSLGINKNISVMYERYNLTASNTSLLNLSQFNSMYLNLTSTPVVKKFNLDYRQNEGYNEAINGTYWRMYVPTGVAGSCSGNIIFSAIRQIGT